jgi:hypothetical protein
MPPAPGSVMSPQSVYPPASESGHGFSSQPGRKKTKVPAQGLNTIQELNQTQVPLTVHGEGTSFQGRERLAYQLQGPWSVSRQEFMLGSHALSPGQ